MQTRRWLLIIETGALTVLVMLALLTGLTYAQGPEPGAERALPLAADAVGNYIPVQGRLTDAGGNPLNGNFSITFRLYEASSGGTVLCQDTNTVSVDNGLFSSEIWGDCGADDVNGRQLYLGIEVGSDGEMTPRQPIYAVPYAWSLRPGAVISSSLSSNAVVHIENWATTGRGLRAYAMSTTGTNYGLVGASRSPDGYGGYFYNNGGGDAVLAESLSSSGGDGVQAESNSTSGRGLYAVNNANGVALAAYTNSPSTTLHLYPTLYLVQADSSGDFVVGAGSYYGTRYWRVDRTGKGFFNGGTQASGADFAEQIDVLGDEANYEPGDVLVISSHADRAVELSVQPFTSAVIGIYSTKPGYLAGAPDTDDPLGGIPVAITGIVPCKVSAENGPIQRGDLLVTSSTPGYAMRAGANPPQGTVLGKAMGELHEGTGVIQILVTLQ